MRAEEITKDLPNFTPAILEVSKLPRPNDISVLGQTLTYGGIVNRLDTMGYFVDMHHTAKMIDWLAESSDPNRRLQIMMSRGLSALVDLTYLTREELPEPFERNMNIRIGNTVRSMINCAVIESLRIKAMPLQAFLDSFKPEAIDKTHVAENISSYQTLLPLVKGSRLRRVIRKTIRQRSY